MTIDGCARGRKRSMVQSPDMSMPPSWQRWLRQPQSVRLRRAVFQVHLWSGLGIGLYVIAISISGSILVYRSELRQTFEPQPRLVEIVGERMTEEELTAAAERAYPDHSVRRVILRDDPAQASTVTIARDGEPSQMLFDPYTGEDLGHRLPLPYRLTTWLLDLHDNLLGGQTGRRVNGVGAILLTLLALTGSIIWWPGAAGWRRALVVDWRANWRRLTWTLHGAIGIWTLLFVLMWGVTGIYLAFPEPFTALGDAIEPFDEESFEPRTVDMILYWVARVHFGRFGGTLTKVSWFAIGLLPPVLFVTGAIMWWNRVVRPRMAPDAPRRAAVPAAASK